MRLIIHFALVYSVLIAIAAIYYFQRSVRGIDDRPIEPEIVFGMVSALGLMFGGALAEMEKRLSRIERQPKDRD